LNNWIDDEHRSTLNNEYIKINWETMIQRMVIIALLTVACGCGKVPTVDTPTDPPQVNDPDVSTLGGEPGSDPANSDPAGGESGDPQVALEPLELAATEPGDGQDNESEPNPKKQLLPTTRLNSVFRRSWDR
jgi:hypothetical protein